MKSVLRILFRTFSVFLGFCLCLLAAGFVVVVFLNSPPSALPQEEPGGTLRIAEDGSVLIEIRKGESGVSVGKRLEEARLIKNRYFWYFLARLDSRFVKTGVFRLEIPASQLAIHRALVDGRQMLERVTVPEGLTLRKTARILEDAGICGAEALLLAAEDPALLASYSIAGPTMEGYLFPDTYLFPRDYPPDLVIRAMADNFFSRLAGLSGGGAAAGDLRSLVILASIIEREYRVADEAALMAGVFLNRLRIGMALQSCATVEYVITEVQGKPHPALIYTRDTEIRDPYNTYQYPGLPPGPICSPGALALEAALSPRDSDYLYFRLVDPGAGRHYFSRTYDDHIKAGVFYVKEGAP
jgi:UPF0755 protein